jgi:hypothetical protein
VEPEETCIARQRYGIQVSAATDMRTTIEELLRIFFPIRLVQSGYKGSSVENRQPSSGVPSEELVQS